MESSTQQGLSLIYCWPSKIMQAPFWSLHSVRPCSNVAAKYSNTSLSPKIAWWRNAYNLADRWIWGPRLFQAMDAATRAYYTYCISLGHCFPLISSDYIDSFAFLGCPVSSTCWQRLRRWCSLLRRPWSPSAHPLFPAPIVPLLVRAIQALPSTFVLPPLSPPSSPYQIWSICLRKKKDKAMDEALLFSASTVSAVMEVSGVGRKREFTTKALETE